MTIYKLIAGYIIKQMQENCWVMSLSFSLLNLFQTFLFIECSWFVRKNDQNISLSIFNHGIAHANQLWFSQQWYGANHGANRFADSRRNLGPARVRKAREPLWHGVQGPAKGPRWGPGGGAPGSSWVIAL